MLITHDYSYTNKNLIENGYAVHGIHSLNFDKYFTEKEKDQNRQYAEQYGNMSREWVDSCDRIGQEICKQMESMMEVLDKKYAIYQYNSQVEYGKHNLHFCSNRGWNGKEWYDHIQLCFNDRLDKDRNDKILNELLKLIAGMELKSVVCRVQYKTVTDDEKLYRDATKRYKDLEGKFVNLRGCVGKVKVVGENNGKKQYGFFKKGARKYYNPLSDTELIFEIAV